MPDRLLHPKKILLTTVAGLLLLLMTVSLTACYPLLIERTPTLTIVDPSFQQPTSVATVTPTPAVSQTTTVESAAAAETTARSATDIEAEIESLILKGLQRRSTSIKIDAAIEPRSIPETEIEAFIDRVFAVYQRIFLSHPEFFYLSGSINISYSREGVQGYLNSMTVKPVYWDSFTSLTEEQLDRQIQEVQAAARHIREAIASQTSVPWKQLLLLHDDLVRSIVYEASQDQQYNNVYSALVGKTTLCQGYAQSFQMIAQSLGFEVMMVMGESDGVGHAWNIVKLDGQYYHIDVTFDDPVPDSGSARPIQHVHFLRSDARLAETHTWKREDYPRCPSDGAYYYSKQDLTVDSLDSFSAMLSTYVNGIDFSKNQTNRLELLYTGSKTPQNGEIGEIVRSVLLNAKPAASVHYSNQVNLGIIIVDIIPE